MTEPPRIRISRFDHTRIEQLIDRIDDRPDIDALREELDRAEIIETEEVPPDLVTMNSVVTFVDDRGKETEVRLVFPGTKGGSGRVSIFAPIGSALIGLTIGDSIDWPLPNGRTRRLRVIDISYQPEAAGDPI